ncbi:hypothetical protein Poli38472_000845 [Pythium oligandrum]|uniref:Uncharacterized protein n=1 Tax=Pythium oligandrum TaxID=41045 RepID=A0A8K1CDX1_PYTOL|nr:hypothetical protein Poli38472_000845 [Pythium oligandrum]|eukprot:TMW60803.1 hypothetical protein Poli38472_000845 [Pythium oligandrum]
MMLRSGSIAVEDDGDDASLLHRTVVPIDAVSAEMPAAAAPLRTEAEELKARFTWSLLLPALAECLTTCFLPDWYVPGWRVNATATMINLVGPFIDGMAYGYEEQLKEDAPVAPCLEFRAAFLGAFTSYSFMVDHAGDLSKDSVFEGGLYICGTTVAACYAFHLGKVLACSPKWIRFLDLWSRSTLIAKMPSFMLGSNMLICLTLVRALFGNPGFVRDPKDPQFIGTIKVADGEELVLGIFMSCTGILVSQYLSTLLKPRPDANGNVTVLDWSNLICNFLSCWLTGLAYEASKLSPGAIRNNLLIKKFVSSFCGSLSSFSGGISEIMLLWHADYRRGASWNLFLHVVAGLLFLPYLHKT